MRAKAMSKGVSERPAEARAITMKAVQTSTVTMAAPMPMVRAEKRGAAGIARLSRGGHAPRCRPRIIAPMPPAAVPPAAAPRPSARSPCRSGCCAALALAPPPCRRTSLPPEVDAALARAKVPRDAVTMLVVDADGTRPPRLAWRTQAPVNPASIMKLVTTYAALDLLGPGLHLDHAGVRRRAGAATACCDGNLYIKGQGDPKLVLERLWLLLRRVQGLGIQHDQRRHRAGPQRLRGRPMPTRPPSTARRCAPTTPRPMRC